MISSCTYTHVEVTSGRFSELFVGLERSPCYVRSPHSRRLKLDPTEGVSYIVVYGIVTEDIIIITTIIIISYSKPIIPLMSACQHIYRVSGLYTIAYNSKTDLFQRGLFRNLWLDICGETNKWVEVMLLSAERCDWHLSFHVSRNRMHVGWSLL